ncbi:uncharacterized protein [Spinacia oleracea]|uniref:Endonuclease/exonuclease/phosphatase domain-containing protein n=1 Tax=Spinacia oleracea TaxID=3562 RepID=A0ABM3RRF1_SPIOL|nr:uncharacterized protein LOC130471883 [Spinacia oleracea]
MNLCSWNCRGLGATDSPKVPYIGSVVRSLGLDVLFLMETMLPVHIVSQKLSAFSFAGSCGVDALRMSGGLFLGWFHDVSLVPLLVSSNFVLCKYLKVVNEISYLLFVYGAPHVADRGLVWEEIFKILTEYPKVVLVGDFNQVEFLDDKIGGSPHISQRLQFMQWRLDQELQPIQFSGPPFTWTNGHHDNSVTF